LQGVEDLGADGLIPVEVDARKAAGFLGPLQILRRKFVAMLAENIKAVLLLHVLECMQVKQHI
jgi:hypothetical protein